MVIDPRGLGARLVFISNALDPPADEGIRNVSAAIAQIVERRGGRVVDLARQRLVGQKLLMGGGLPRGRGARIVYVPTQSATSATLLRIALLRLAKRPATVVLLAAQLRHPWARHVLPPRLRPDVVVSPSRAMTVLFQAAGWRAEFLPLGVDTNRFAPGTPADIRATREALDLPVDRKVLLHVGHFKKKRNLSWLAAAKETLAAEVVMVGSTSMTPDPTAAPQLRAAGVRTVETFVPDIAAYYRACDCYLFPVLDEDAAVGVPLSVLEAMACNLPVVTTPFGGLPAMFEPRDGLHFAATQEAWLGRVAEVLAGGEESIATREQVLQYDWEEVADRILRAG